MKLMKMMSGKYGEILRYLVVGVLTTVVSLAVYYGLVFTVLDPKSALQLQVANILSWIGAVAFAYVTNRIFVFKSKNKNFISELSRFVTARLTTLVMDMVWMFLFVTVFKGNDKLGKLIAQVIVLVGNYIFSKLFVFRKKQA